MRKDDRMKPVHNNRLFQYIIEQSFKINTKEEGQWQLSEEPEPLTALRWEVKTRQGEHASQAPHTLH